MRYSSGETSIGFQWSAPANGYNSITGYIVKSNGGSGSTFSEIGTTGPATTTFTETGLANGQVYEFIVIATNEVGSSDPSSPTALRVAVVPDAPGAPAKTFANGSTIEIQWTAPADNGGSVITKYEILQDDGLGGGFQSIGFTADGVTTTHSQSVGIIEGGSYFYRIGAFNEIGPGALSQASGKIIAAVVPEQPLAPVLSSQSETAITITWKERKVHVVEK